MQPKKDIDQARKTELSLLERFGLAPDSEPAGTKSKSTKSKRLPESTISLEEVRQPKRGKPQQQVKDYSGTKSSGPSTVQHDNSDSMCMLKRDSFHARSRGNSDQRVPPIPVSLQEQEKQSSVPTFHKPSSCEPMSEVASDRKLQDRSEDHRKWQPNNFDLDDECVWSFNNNDSDSDVQVITAPKTLDVVSTVPEENLPSAMESPPVKTTQDNAPVTSKSHAVSRVVSEKKKRKIARKAAKKDRHKKRKAGKRKKQKKKPRGELFDQPFPESVQQSLEEDAVEEGQPYASAKVQATTPRQASNPGPKTIENGSPDQPIVIDDGSDMEEDAVVPKQVEQPPLLLLCSEGFLELWGDTASRLVTGNWQQKSPTIGDGPGRRFFFTDTKLVDACGVDIELPNREGIVMSALSGWNDNDGFNELMMRVVALISTTRYRHLNIFLCADVDQDDSIVDRIATLQNAVLHQGDGLVTATAFTLVSPDALAASIGQSLLTLDSAWELEEIEACLDDDRTFERLLFLVQLIPTLTATSILLCLMSSPEAQRSPENKSRSWFQSLFHQDDRERKRMQRMDPNCCIQQWSSNFHSLLVSTSVTKVYFDRRRNTVS